MDGMRGVRHVLKWSCALGANISVSLLSICVQHVHVSGIHARAGTETAAGVALTTHVHTHGVAVLVSLCHVYMCCSLDVYLAITHILDNFLKQKRHNAQRCPRTAHVGHGDWGCDAMWIKFHAYV